MTDETSDLFDALMGMPLLRDILSDLDSAGHEALVAGARWYGVPGGMRLFTQGEHSTDLFAVLGGRFGVLVDQGLGPRLVHHARPGELLGEMALITGEARSATVIALRDSEVLHIPGALAEQLLTTNRALTAHLLRLLARRLQSTTLRPTVHATTEAIAVVPITAAPLGDDDVARIAAAFAGLKGLTLVIDQAGAAQPGVSDGARLVNIARDRDSGWARGALRQADRVLFVAPATDPPDAVANTLAERARTSGTADLMLLQPATAILPSGALPWLGSFSPDQIFHAARGNAADHARVARLVTGQAIGLVLAGGGARGFAHIGVLRALHEAAIPIDLIAGTSMGALVGATAAMEGDVEAVSERLYDTFVRTRPRPDYTFPWLALTRGRRMTRMFKQHYGTTRIEECWRTFFCVSSNLSTGLPHVHQHGLLWRALRATAALPGIMPPLIENGEVLVDGAIMNNFPVDIMAGMARGRVIGVDVANGAVFDCAEPDVESRSLAWLLGPGRGRVPNIFRLLMRTGLVASATQSEASRRAADLLIQPRLGAVDLLSFDRFEEAVEAGYRAANEAIDALETPFV